MSGAQLVRRANAVTFAAMCRAGMEIPLYTATSFGSAWELFKTELATHGLRVEWVGSGYAVREGAQRPIAASEVPGAPDWDTPLIRG